VYTSNNDNWARWRRVVAAGTVGGRRRWCRQEAVAGGSGWRLAQQLAKTKQDRGYRGGRAEHGGEDWMPASSAVAAATSGGLSGWRQWSVVGGSGQQEEGEEEEKKATGGSHRQQGQRKQREKGL